MTYIRPRSSAFICGLALLAGCEVTHENESDTRKAQQAALRDPYKVGPDASKMTMPGHDPDEVDPTDITGGGTSNLNKKALKRDWDALWGND